MTLWEYLDSAGDRRAAWREFVLERRLAHPRPNLWTPQLFIGVLVIGLFAWALSANPDDDTMKGALIAGFAGAWGYFLGSSQASAKANERTDVALALTHDAVKALPAPAPSTDVSLEPGESATVKAEAAQPV